MKARHPFRHMGQPPSLPRYWLVTDERAGGADAIMAAIPRLPRPAGVIFRHLKTAPDDRLAFFRQISRACQRRGICLIVAGTPSPGIRPASADGWFGTAIRRPAGARLHLAAVHDLQEALVARRAGADMAVISPVFATHSHPGQRGIGPVRAAMLARAAGCPAVLMGGMTVDRLSRLPGGQCYGMAAIDGWMVQGRKPPAQRRLSVQKRKAVPK